MPTPVFDPATIREALSDRLPDTNQAILLTGSVALGWQHARSDADLYVISSAPWEGEPDGFNHVAVQPNTVPTATSFAGDLRLETRYWTDDQVDQVLEKASWEVFRTTDPAGLRMYEAESTFLSRLPDAIAVAGSDWLKRRQDQLAASAFRSMLTVRWLNRADNFVEDVVGMLESGDRHAAVLASQCALECASDALTSYHGQFDSGDKWRARRVAAIASPVLPFDRFWELTTMRNLDPTNPEKWIDDVLRLCRQVAMAVEA